MKRRALERHLRTQGCILHHHGGRHDVWMNPVTGSRSPVPRHTEVKKETVRGICRILGIPTPRAYDNELRESSISPQVEIENRHLAAEATCQ